VAICASPSNAGNVAANAADKATRIWVCSQSLSARRATPSGWEDPQGNQVFWRMNECIPEVAMATRACVKRQVHANFPAYITADDPAMVARSKYVLSQFGP
jgi:hypothetical protein